MTMQLLNDLVEKAERADAVASLMDGINPHQILAIAEYVKGLENHIADAGKMMGWVKCIERLPEKSGDYLVLCHYPKFHERCFVQHVMNFLHTAYETPVMRWYDSERAKHITHWQPLPEAPHD